VNHLATITPVEWGAQKLIKGCQEKQMGYLEILAWHLVEVGEFRPLGLPYGKVRKKRKTFLFTFLTLFLVAGKAQQFGRGY
jgi:hypothetical protein